MIIAKCIQNFRGKVSFKAEFENEKVEVEADFGLPPAPRGLTQDTFLQ